MRGPFPSNTTLVTFKMSQVDLMRIMREDLPIDAARTIEANIEREMELTPYKYVPVSDATGKEITLDDHAPLVIDATTGKYDAGTGYSRPNQASLLWQPP